MRCAYCNGETKVTCTVGVGDSKIRERACKVCKKKFWTEKKAPTISRQFDLRYEMYKIRKLKKELK